MNTRLVYFLYFDELQEILLHFDQGLPWQSPPYSKSAVVLIKVQNLSEFDA